MAPATTDSRRRRTDVAEVLIVLACGLTAFFGAIFIPAAATHSPGLRDYVVYWATAQQLVHHGNPYDPVALGVLERAWGQHTLGYMRNLPFSLPLVWPLGWVGAKLGSVLWTLVLVAALVGAVRLSWLLVRTPGSNVSWIGFLSPLAMNVVIAGQTSLFSLLGLALFLRLHRSRPFAAGAALWFCALKPHLLLPLAAALLIWIFFSRAWGVLAGALTALAASCALTAWMDPAAWGQYIVWARTSGIAEEKLACLSVALRNLIDPRVSWLTYIPAAVGCVWALSYFWRKRRQWNWAEHGSLALVVSLTVTPYCIPWDQFLAIPALMFAACRTESRAVLGTIAASYLAIDVLLLCGFRMHSMAWVWLGPFWLVWYVWARRTAGAQPAAAVEPATALSAG